MFLASDRVVRRKERRDVSVFILIHIDADDDGIPLRMMMLPMKKTSDDL
jgi:hypothetical protein